MATNPDLTVRQAAKQFCDLELLDLKRFGGGNINDTFLASFGGAGPEPRQLVLQRINGAVFPDPRRIAANMEAVGRCIDSVAGGKDFIYPRLLPDRAGDVLWVDEEGACWRACVFVGWAVTFQVVADAAFAAEVGRIIGRFHRLTAGLDPAALHDTLPGYRDCPRHLRRYDSTVSACSQATRSRMAAGGVKDMMDFVEARRDRAAVLEDAAAAGKCAQRVMHGDPKADNVLIDRRSGRGVGLIDFDTVKPGLWLYDFGDACRSVCNPAGEDAPAERVAFDMSRFVPFARCYAGETAALMDGAERSLLGESIWLQAFELGIRFLGDYLAGDVYFRVSDLDRNRRRALVQFMLCREIEKNAAAIERVIGEATEGAL